MKKQIRKQLPKQFNPFEQLIQVRDDRKIKKIQKSKSIIDPQLKKNGSNKFKISQELKEEMQNQKSKNLFQLDSEDENEQNELKNWKLTHRGILFVQQQQGKDLNENNDYKDNIDQFSDSDDEQAKDLVKNYHFSGFDSQKDKKLKRTRAEVYQDIIINSKIRRQEKLRQKDESLAKLQELNNVFPLIAEHFQIAPKKRPKNQDDEYANLATMFRQDEKIIAVETFSKEKTAKELAKEQKWQNRRNKQIEKLEDSDDTDASNDNDEQIPRKKVQTEKERKLNQGYKKVQHLSNMMDNVRKVKRVNLEEDSDEFDELESSQANDDESQVIISFSINKQNEQEGQSDEDESEDEESKVDQDDEEEQEQDQEDEDEDQDEQDQEQEQDDEQEQDQEDQDEQDQEQDDEQEQDQEDQDEQDQEQERDDEQEQDQEDEQDQEQERDNSYEQEQEEEQDELEQDDNEEEYANESDDVYQ